YQHEMGGSHAVQKNPPCRWSGRKQNRTCGMLSRESASAPKSQAKPVKEVTSRSQAATLETAILRFLEVFINASSREVPFAASHFDLAESNAVIISWHRSDLLLIWRSRTVRGAGNRDQEGDDEE